MNLHIVKDYKPVNDLNTIVLSADMLRQTSTHLFISSNTWEVLNVELCTMIPEGVLSCVRPLVKDIVVDIPESATEYEMKLLTELYPEQAGAIRKQFMFGRSLKGIV